MTRSDIYRQATLYHGRQAMLAIMGLGNNYNICFHATMAAHFAGLVLQEELQPMTIDEMKQAFEEIGKRPKIGKPISVKRPGRFVP